PDRRVTERGRSACPGPDHGKLAACPRAVRGGPGQVTMAPTRNDRLPSLLRHIEVTTGFLPHAEGSALVTWGRTRVVAAVTIENKLPPHLRGAAAKGGWLTAEYSLLPRSTAERTPRERLYAGGRTQEIQRFIG